MKHKSSYEIWDTKRTVLSGCIDLSKKRIIELTDKLTHTNNLIREEEVTLYLLQNNLGITEGRVETLPKPEPME